MKYKFRKFNDQVDKFKEEHPGMEVSPILLATISCIGEEGVKSMSVQARFEHTEKCPSCQDWIKRDRLK